ncbi:MAG: hypothetical protein Ct9H90mP13_05220 [Pseudomonadota bacterium]|nr:MAG: hypothetical protein Ct9H90mP13_05220 [Pseudomonadota bacterium]
MWTLKIKPCLLNIYIQINHQALIAFRTSNSDFTKDKDAWNVEYG